MTGRNRQLHLALCAAGAVLVVGLGLAPLLDRGAPTGAGGRTDVPAIGLTASDRAKVDHALGLLAPEGRAAPIVGATSTTQYEAAAAAYRTCVRSTFGRTSSAGRASLEVAPAVFSADRFQLDVALILRSPGLDSAQAVEAQTALDTAQRSCRDTELAATELAYQAGRLADPAYLGRASDGFGACVGRAGIALDASSNPRTILAASGSLSEVQQDAVADCAAAYPSISTVLAPLAAGG